MLFQIPVFAEDDEEAENIILYGDFEDEEEALKYYTGGVIDPAAAYEGHNGMQVSNPYGETGFNLTTHILEYEPEFTLNAGEFYTLSFYVCNPMADEDSEVEAYAYLSESSILSVSVSSIPADWSFVSVSFMAQETKDYTLSLVLYGGDEYVGFFIDSLTLIVSEKYPVYASLDGNTTVFVPEEGALSYRYSLNVHDEDGDVINIFINDYDITAENLPEGVEFDSETTTLLVYPTAPSDAEFTLICSADVGIELKESSLTITTTRNLLLNPSFESDEEYWESDFEMEYSGGMLNLYAEEVGDYGRYVSIRYTEQLILREGLMYVFRADVKSEDDYPASSVYIVNSSFAASGFAEINITGIGGGEWSNVFSAFTVDQTGVYELTLYLYAPSERPIYLDNVWLGVEDAEASSISIHAPGNICRPSSSVTLPCYALVHDQLGRVMETIDVEMSPESEKVRVSNGSITVTSSAPCRDYYISASYGDLEAEITVTVSDDAVGDGGFEEKAANEWWAASDGAYFDIVDTDDNNYGYVASADNTCLLINNSYMELLSDEYYVFSASAALSANSVTITAFIADAFSDDYIPLVQFDALTETTEAFMVDETVVGRLVLYIESDSPIAVLLDDIAIFEAELAVSNVEITYDDVLYGTYDYMNNMTSSDEADISSYVWYIASDEDFSDEMIVAENQIYLDVTPEMLGKYVALEVIPICSVTGLSGDAVRSEPIRITSALLQSEDNNEVDVTNSVEPISLQTAFVAPFDDTSGHWAEQQIATLYASGVVSGRGDNLFSPDESVTRAEFTAMVARAFSLSPVEYDNTFTDVSPDDWHSGIIAAAVEAKLVYGVGDNLFVPDEYITREQMAVIIYRAYLAAGGEVPTSAKNDYYDSPQISSWAEISIDSTTELGIFYGNDMNLFEPRKNATRAEAAAVICRTLELF
ncbi:MAG: S-layer homology domain-containing protein [Clostridia bacterium]|nr:S-layer homology domain-containing protein [Clostridia bacterium]